MAESVNRVDFDEAAYLAANPDVAAAVIDGALGSGEEHFRAHGMKEGRSGLPSVALDRVGKAMLVLKRDGLGLEIGPSHNPIAPKKAGYNVHILDHSSAEELRAKYAGHASYGVEIGNIEDIDFVWKGQPFEELVGSTSRYDWIVASHVIEHVPDFVSFIRQCEAILKPKGRLSLIIPDRRYCFDFFGHETSTGEVLDAFLEKRLRPSRGQIFDYIANAVKCDEKIAWSAETRGPMQLIHSFTQAREMSESAGLSPDYIDVHAWRFTPASFRLIISDLQKLGLIAMGISLEFDTSGCEFYVTMERDKVGRTENRLQRLSKIRDAA